MNEPIPISSSDGDIDYEYGSIEVEDDAFSTNVRAQGYGEHSEDVFFPQSATSRMKRPLNHGHTLHSEYPRNPCSDAGFQSSTSQRKFPSAEHQNYSMRHLESLAFPFPPSFHSKKHKETPAFPFPPSFRTKPNNFRDSEHMRQFNGSGNSYPFAGPSSLNGQNHEKHTFDKDFIHATPFPSGRYGSSVDPIDPFRNGDEKLGGTDERSVFQEVIQDLNQPKQEAELPNGLLSVPLLRHQKIALAWMRQKEARPFCVGGILADDQGLGKTISTIALIQMERHSEQKSKFEDHKNHETLALTLDDDDDKGVVSLDDIKPAKDLNAVKFTSNGNHKTLVLNLDDDDQKGIINLDEVKPAKDLNVVKFVSKGSSSQQSSSKQRPAAGTLVVCPATVLRQWARELQDKVTEEAKLKVLVYHGSNRTKDPSELASYDVVLTTYALVANEVPKQPLVDEDDNGENHEKNAENSLGAKRKKNQSRFPKKGKKSKRGLDSCFFESESGTLAKVRWLRVVLDEAQTIKNHRTQAARACCGLRAKKRWCLSGTPMQNTIDELFSYFRFLKYDPYSSFKAFREGIKAPITKDSNSGYKKLQVVLRTVMLRRTKGTIIDGKPILSLPPKHINMNSLVFTSEERDFYTKLEFDSRLQFKAYDDAGTVNQNYANILLMLLRLRQACDHPYLCEAASDFARKTDSIKTLKQLPKDTVISLNNRLQGSVICQSCEDTPEDAIVTICGHIFCDQCVLDHLSSDDNTCPARNCKEQLSTKVIFSKATFRSFMPNGSESSSSQSNCNQRGEKSLSVSSSEYTSSKIKTALYILQSLGKPSVPCKDLDGSAEDDALKSDALVHARTEIINHGSSEARKKAIVFSQWTRMLGLMEKSLVRYGIHFHRLDGTMSLAARDNSVREFNSDPEVDVMLMSLKAGNLGLNMVAACHVILLDLWWNPTTEDQAIDRAHRIGQTRAVTVSRLTVKDTVEDRILALQEKKRKMVASAFGEENTGGSARLTVQDLRFLFMGA